MKGCYETAGKSERKIFGLVGGQSVRRGRQGEQARALQTDAALVERVVLEALRKYAGGSTTWDSAQGHRLKDRPAIARETAMSRQWLRID